MSSTVASNSPTLGSYANTIDEEKARLPDATDIPSPVSNKELEATTSLPTSTDIEVKLDDNENPLKMSKFRKWVILSVICQSALLTTCASSIASGTLPHIIKRFNIGFYVATLPISFYILGLGIGPLFLGGLSEFLGRSSVYRVSFLFAFLFSFPCAFTNNIPVLLVFRFLVAFASSAFLSVAGGSLADLFTNEEIALPIAIFSMSPLVGPVLGPVFSGFINQHLYWRWTYHILTIWFGVQFLLICFLIPETYAPILIARKAQRLRKETGDNRYFAPLERKTESVNQLIKLSFFRPFQMLIQEPMVLALDIWISLVLGIVYLTFPVFPIIFGGMRHFNQQSVGLSYLGIGLGIVVATALQPYWTAVFIRDLKKHKGNPPPEVRLKTGMVAAILLPLGLFLFAFTLYKSVHWIVPIILIAPFGAGAFWAFTSVITFLVSTYRPYAASAVASNAFLRSVFAGAFPLIAKPMYERMGNVGATAFLGGLMTLFAPLPFLFYRYGPILRAKSRYAF